MLLGCSFAALLVSLVAPVGGRHNQFATSPITLFSARLAMAAQNSSFSTKLEKTQFNGWNAYRLTNGIVTLYVAPDIGAALFSSSWAKRGSSS
jgi:hypothetical protein